MFRSTLSRIKRVCSRAVVTSTYRDKTYDGLFGRSAEFRKKPPNKAEKFDEQKKKCLNIIDECFAPLEPYRHQQDNEAEAALVDNTRQVHLAQIEKEKCEKILYQCFGEAEGQRTEETAETEFNKEAVQTIQTLHETKHCSTPIAHTVDSKVQIETVKGELVTEKLDDTRVSETQAVTSEAETRIIKGDDAVRCEETRVLHTQVQSLKGEGEDKSVFQETRYENEADAICRVLKAFAAKKAAAKCRRDEPVHLIHRDNEIKVEEIDAIQKFDGESNSNVTYSNKNNHQVQDDIKAEKIKFIDKTDDENQNGDVKIEGSPGEYMNGKERQQFEKDLKAIHVLKDSILFDDLKTVEKHLNMKRHKWGNKNIELLPGHTVNKLDVKSEIENPVCLKVDLDNRISSAPEDIVRKDIKQEQQVPYREVLQTAELHYKQLENVVLNSAIAQEELKLSKTESAVVKKDPELTCAKGEKVEISETDKLILDIDTENPGTVRKKLDILSPKQHHTDTPKTHEIRTVRAEPPKDKEILQPISSKEEKVQQDEPENWKINIDILEQPLESENSEQLSSKEEKLELFETDKLRMNTTDTLKITRQGQQLPYLGIERENENFNQPEKLNLNRNHPKELTKRRNLESSLTDSIEELDGAESLKINIFLARNDTDSDIPKIQSEASLKSVIHNHSFMIGHKNTEVEPRETNNLQPKEEARNAKEDARQKALRNKDVSFKGPKKIKVYDYVMPSHFNNYTLDVDTVEPQIKRQHLDTEVIESNITKPNIVNFNNATSEAEIKCEQNNYTPQIDIANEMALHKEDIESTATKALKAELEIIERHMSEQSHYTPQIYLQKLNFECLKQEHFIDPPNISETQNEELNVSYEREKVQILRFTNSKMTELDHYTTQIYTDAIMEAQKVLTPIKERKKQLKKQRLEKAALTMSTETDTYCKDEQQSYSQNIHPVTCIASQNENTAEPKMTELNHYTTQIYTDAIMEAQKVLTPIKERKKQLKKQRLEKAALTMSTETDTYCKDEQQSDSQNIHPVTCIANQNENTAEPKMTELNHYTPQIYIDAIMEAQKVLTPLNERKKQLQKEKLEKAALTMSTATDTHCKDEQQSYLQNIHPVTCIASQNENTAKPKKMRKNNIIFAQLDASAIDQSLNQMLHTKAKLVAKSTATNCYDGAPSPANNLPKDGDNLDLNVPFDETIKNLVGLDSEKRFHRRKHRLNNDNLEYHRKKDVKETVASLRSKDLDVLQNEYERLREKILYSTRDIGTSLIKELKGNVKERAPATYLDVDRIGNLYSSRVLRRHRHHPRRDNVDTINVNYYDKIATEWIRNEEQNASEHFDNIASLHKARCTEDELERDTGRLHKMPKIEDDGFLANAHAPICNEEHTVCEKAMVTNAVTKAETDATKPRSGEIPNPVKIGDVAIELEKKFPEKCIGSSEILPSFYNKEQIVIMGDMSKSPLHLQCNSEKQDSTVETDIISTRTDNDYHRKAIKNLISNISHLRGYLDEGNDLSKYSLHPYHDQQAHRHAMLYRAVVDTVTKTENILREDSVENHRGSESEGTYYSAEDLLTNEVRKAKTTMEPKYTNTSDKNALNSPVGSTETSQKDDRLPSKTISNSTNAKNLNFTTTIVFNGDMNSTFDNPCSNLTGNQRNDLSADALLSAVRNYSKGSTSKQFNYKQPRDSSVFKESNEKVVKEMPQEPAQCNCFTQTQPNQPAQQTMYCEHCQNNIKVTYANQNKGIKSFIDALHLEKEQDVEDQEAISLRKFIYVENNPEPESNPTSQKEEWIDPSYVNTVETHCSHREETILPHVEQIAWDHQEYESKQVTVEPKHPTENMSNQLFQEENNLNDNLSNERFLSYYEPRHDYPRQQNNYSTLNEMPYEMGWGKNGSHRNKETQILNYKEVQTGEYKMAVDETQQTQEPWSEQMRSRSYHPCPNEQHNIYYYDYEPQANKQCLFKNISSEQTSDGKTSLTDQYYKNHTTRPDFEYLNQTVYETDINETFYDSTMTPLSHQLYSQSDPYYAQAFIPPPSAGCIPTFRIIQNPSIAQALNLGQHDHYHQYGYYEENGSTVPMYRENYRNVDSFEMTQPFNTTHERLRTLQNSYERSQIERAKKVKEEEFDSVLLTANSENAKDRLLKEQKTQELPYPQTYNYHNYNNNYCYNNYDNISEKEQYSYNYDASYDNIPDTRSYQSAPNNGSRQACKGNESNHEYYDASSHQSIPSNCIHQNHNNYPYYSTMPDYAALNECHKQHSNMMYSPYIQVSICPLAHKPGQRCEHCCAEDTSRPNELVTRPDEAEMKTHESQPKKPDQGLRFTKPRIKKRKSGSRGSGRGAVEKGTSIARELELNTAITLPSLDENLKLSELLDRVRKRNRLLNMVEVLKPYDPIQMVKCDDRDPPKPPSNPKILVGPGKCPKSNPKPCKIPCPRPIDPCDKHKPKDPCNRSSAEKLTLMVYVGKRGKEKRPKGAAPKSSSDNPGGKRMAGVTQILVTAMVKLRKLIEGSDTSLNTSDSEESGRIDLERSLKRAEVVAEKLRPKVKKVGKQTPLDHLKQGMLQARKHLTSGLPKNNCPADDVFYDA